MIILGIDPGIAIVGWGVIDANNGKIRTIDYGAITTEANEDTEARLCQIYEQLIQIINRYKPVSMAIEELFWNTNQKTGIRVAEARGVTLLAAKQNNMKIFEYTPLQVKQAVVGYGRAEKKQVMAMVTRLLGLEKTPKPDDTCDALAIAVCHAHCGESRIAEYFNK